MTPASDIWSELPYAGWRRTLATLHLWTQVVGKVRLSLTPWLNRSWQVPLYVTARGLATGPVPFGHEVFEVEFDFVAPRLQVRTGQGLRRSFPLESQSVADFYGRALDLFAAAGVSVSINESPTEVPEPVPFPSTASMRITMPQRRIASGARSCRWTGY